MLCERCARYLSKREPAKTRTVHIWRLQKLFSLQNLFVVFLEKQIGLLQRLCSLLLKTQSVAVKQNEELIPFSIWRLVGMSALPVPKFLLQGSIVAGFHVSSGPTSQFGWIWSPILNMLIV